MSAQSETIRCARCGSVLPVSGTLAGKCPSCLLEAGLHEDSATSALNLNDRSQEGLLPAGTQIGPYQIEGLIGAGGMGQVYLAQDTRLGRKVAIKFLSTEVADTAGRRRFQREAQMASALNHPHILTVYDAGEFEGRQYLVTEFVDGGTLKNWFS